MDLGKLCSICLDLLKDPVTIPCGHNYCMNCIKSYWDQEHWKYLCSCPQCRQTFRPRPALGKNTMLAELLKEQVSELYSPEVCYAESGDVACDFCTGRKLKAAKSCLQCLVSYCEQHLQPHYNVAALKKHKLVDPFKKLQENICPYHNEVMKIFCQTDQQCICYLCSIDEHKGHCIVSAAAERSEKEKELKLCREKIHQRTKDREEDVMTFQDELDSINYSADKVVKDSEKIFNELILLIEKRRSELQQQIRSQQETKLNRTKECLEKVQQELSELKRKDAELEQLSHTEDSKQFLQMFPLVSHFCESTVMPQKRCPNLVYFKGVVSAVSEVNNRLQRDLCEGWEKVLWTVNEPEMLLPRIEPKTSTDFLQSSKSLTQDSCTEHSLLEKPRPSTQYQPPATPVLPKAKRRLRNVTSLIARNNRCRVRRGSEDSDTDYSLDQLESTELQSPLVSVLLQQPPPLTSGGPCE